MSYKITRIRSNGQRETKPIDVIWNGVTTFTGALKESETYDIVLREDLKTWKKGKRFRMNVLESSTSNTRVELTQEGVKEDGFVKWSNILAYKGKMVEWDIAK
jgi:hypothetical protein